MTCPHGKADPKSCAFCRVAGFQIDVKVTVTPPGSQPGPTATPAEVEVVRERQIKAVQRKLDGLTPGTPEFEKAAFEFADLILGRTS